MKFHFTWYKQIVFSFVYKHNPCYNINYDTIMEKAVASHSSTFAWKIPWTEEPGRLQSMGLLRVGHGWATSLSLFTFMHWRRKWQTTPLFLLGESQGWGSLVGCIYGVTQSWTRWQRLSRSNDTIKKEKKIKEILNYQFFVL